MEESVKQRGRPRNNPNHIQKRRHVALDDELWEYARILGGGTPGKTDGSHSAGVRKLLQRSFIAKKIVR